MLWLLLDTGKERSIAGKDAVFGEGDEFAEGLCWDEYVGDLTRLFEAQGPWD